MLSASFCQMTDVRHQNLMIFNHAQRPNFRPECHQASIKVQNLCVELGEAVWDVNMQFAVNVEFAAHAPLGGRNGMELRNFRTAHKKCVFLQIDMRVSSSSSISSSPPHAPHSFVYDDTIFMLFKKDRSSSAIVHSISFDLVRFCEAEALVIELSSTQHGIRAPLVGSAHVPAAMH